MRVTQNLNQAQFLASDQDAGIQHQSDAEPDVERPVVHHRFAESDRRPAGVNNYNQALAQSQQYATNATSAQTNLNTEDSALSQVQSQLQSLRDLALEANSGALTNTDRTAIATQAVQIQNSLLDAGQYAERQRRVHLFGGFATQTQPFTLSADGRDLQRRSGSAAGANCGGPDRCRRRQRQYGVQSNQDRQRHLHGLRQCRPTQDPASWARPRYRTRPPAMAAPTRSISRRPAPYQVLEGATLVTSGSYTDGNTIAFNGVQVTLSGTPAAGDSFTVAPSTNQSLFTTVQNLVTALQSGGSTSASSAALNNAINGAINNIDQALAQTSNVRASIGGRLNSITTQQSVATSQQIQLQQSISSLQSLDYAKRHHHAGSTEHDLERRAAGVHADPGAVAVQISLETWTGPSDDGRQRRARGHVRVPRWWHRARPRPARRNAGSCRPAGGCRPGSPCRPSRRSR